MNWYRGWLVDHEDLRSIVHNVDLLCRDRRLVAVNEVTHNVMILQQILRADWFLVDSDSPIENRFFLASELGRMNEVYVIDGIIGLKLLNQHVQDGFLQPATFGIHGELEKIGLYFSQSIFKVVMRFTSKGRIHKTETNELLRCDVGSFFCLL